jgi:ribosomal protein S18 acetylase RimI-like enzyme
MHQEPEQANGRNQGSKHLQLITTRATPQDAARISALEAAWDRSKLPANAMSETGCLSKILGEQRIRELIQSPDALVLVAHSGGELVGMLLAYHQALARNVYPTMSSDYAVGADFWNQPYLYVKAVAVQPTLTGNGIGKELLCYCKNLAIEASLKHILATIAVEPRNRRSLATFEAVLSSEEVGRQRNLETGITWGLFRSAQLC